jgi:acetyl-CoA carboxylase biotin carboxyl carrier protein
MTMTGFKIEWVEQLIEVVKKHGIHQLEVEQKDQKVVIVAQAPHAPQAPQGSGLYPGQHPAMMSQVPGVYPQLYGYHTHQAPPPSGPGGVGIHNGPGNTPPASTPAPTKGRVLRSPFVGTFYRAGAPGAENFVEIGKRVKKGDTLCIVEAMKLMNEIESEADGVISEILVENEQPVEFDQPLFVIE